MESKNEQGIELLEGRNWAPAALGRVLVLGLGKSGRAAVEYCGALLGTRVESVTVAAGDPNPDALAFAQRMARDGMEFRFQTESFASDEHFGLCIASPGISQFSDFYQAALRASDEVISEIEFAWRESSSESTWVAITGTNGKTTTTALIAHIAQCAGQRAEALGNIGDVCLDAVAAGNIDSYIVETSSYQLASTSRFAPRVSVLLNITPDHLAWHTGMDEYRRAKLKALRNLRAVGGTAVLDVTDALCRAECARNAASGPEGAYACIAVGSAAGLDSCVGTAPDDPISAPCADAAWVRDGVLTVRASGVEHAFIPVADLLIKGTHNVSNALAGAAAAVALGMPDEAVIEGLRTFQPLEHRIQPCGTVQGISYFNDSKGTNVDATLKAYTAFPKGRFVVMLGGRDKGTPLAQLVAATRECARAVVCYGESRTRFLAAFAEGAQDCALPVLAADHLADAFDAARHAAQPGDAVLLSPACASFDEFTCFEERGRAFMDLVAALAAQAPESDPCGR